MSSYKNEWFEIETILRSTTKKEKYVDNRSDVDWDLIDQAILSTSLFTGCMILEKSGLKWKDDHTSTLVELRNAFIHNDGDISKNSNKKALENAHQYLVNEDFRMPPLEMTNSYYCIENSKVILNDGIFIAIRKCL